MPSVFLRVLVASTLISLVTGPVSAEQPKSEVKIEHTSEDWSAGNGTFPGVTFGGEPGDKVSMIKVTCELGEEVLKQAPIDRGGQMKHCSLVTAINPPPPKVANNISIQLDCNDGGTPASTLHCITVSRINPPMLQTWGHYTPASIFRNPSVGRVTNLSAGACLAYIQAASSRCASYPPDAPNEQQVGANQNQIPDDNLGYSTQLTATEGGGVPQVETELEISAPTAELSIRASAAEDGSAGEVGIDGVLEVSTSIAGVPIDRLEFSVNADAESASGVGDSGSADVLLRGFTSGSELFWISMHGAFQDDMDGDAMLEGYWSDGTAMTPSDLDAAVDTLTQASGSLVAMAAAQPDAVLCDMNADAQIPAFMQANKPGNPQKCNQMLVTVINGITGLIAKIILVESECGAWFAQNNRPIIPPFKCQRALLSLAGQTWYLINAGINYYCECVVPKPKPGDPLTAPQRFCQIAGNLVLPNDGGKGGGQAPPGPELPKPAPPPPAKAPEPEMEPEVEPKMEPAMEPAMEGATPTP